MSSLTELKEKGHEEVCFSRDPKSGIMMIIAVHSTVLGPALGGTRMMTYTSFDEALRDVLRLSEGMSYKNSLAGLKLGGGKAVIVADSQLKEGRRELFRSFGKFVERLQGRYITAEDLGTSVEDMSSVIESTSYVTGRDPAKGGGGDPSPYTALGVLEGMKACLEHVYGSTDLRGKHVAVQGTGHVGSELCALLVDAGAKLSVSDIRPESAEAVSKKFGATVVSPREIPFLECDIFAPCAVGAVINPTSIKKFRCKIIAGAANNQVSGGQETGGTYLSAESVEDHLHQKGIIYAPDFAVNPGGVILCYDELEPGGFRKDRVVERASRVFSTIGEILRESKSSGESPPRIAVRLAKKRIEEGRGKLSSA